MPPVPGFWPPPGTALPPPAAILEVDALAQAPGSWISVRRSIRASISCSETGFAVNRVAIASPRSACSMRTVWRSPRYGPEPATTMR